MIAVLFKIVINFLLLKAKRETANWMMILGLRAANLLYRSNWLLPMGIAEESKRRGREKGRIDFVLSSHLYFLLEDKVSRRSIYTHLAYALLQKFIIWDQMIGSSVDRPYIHTHYWGLYTVQVNLSWKDLVTAKLRCSHLLGPHLLKIESFQFLKDLKIILWNLRGLFQRSWGGGEKGGWENNKLLDFMAHRNKWMTVPIK